MLSYIYNIRNNNNNTNNSYDTHDDTPELALPASLQKWQSHSVYSLPTVTMLRTEIVPLIIKRMLSYIRNNDDNTTILTRGGRLQHHDGTDN